MFRSLLRQLAEALEARAIPYMVIGGQAVLLYGEPRATKDIDVTLGVDPSKLSVVLDMAREAGWRVLPESPREFALETYVLPCEEPESSVRIDLIFSATPYEAQAIARAARIDIDGVEVRFASVADLVIHKIVAGRPRDIEDVRNVLIKNPDIDLDDVRQWLAQFEEALGQPFLKRLESVI